jgi:dihydropyrimidine dehydrogenase (NAD+) subunit PreT
MSAPSMTAGPRSLTEDLHPALTMPQAMAEADRCLFCWEAPCVQACPTSIDIPGFIRRIQTGNAAGAGTRILEANIMGGTCARVCPTEVLCEASCVRNKLDGTPVAIGRLQRHATDALFASGAQPFTRATATGKSVAVVGAGPAGLACAHRLARDGHDVTVYEAKPKAGGLNEYGLAAYKMAGGQAQKEVDFILSIGGIAIEHGKALGRDVTLAELRAKHDAVFLGVGLGGTNALKVPGEDLEGVEDAVSFIETLRQTPDIGTPLSGKKVVVIGGGNTAIDAAIQAKLMGAEEVTLAYRRGPEHMGATAHEQALAKLAGVTIRPWLKPRRLVADGGTGVATIELEKTKLIDGELVGTNHTVILAADLVLKAVGQTLDPSVLDGLEIRGGKVAVDAQGRTALKGVYAGGDCVKSGQDLTVQSVDDGQRAAAAIVFDFTA